jgi:hypothetical protein
MQRERKIPVLAGITVLFVVHVSGFYWYYKNGDLIRPLVMLPPKEIPPFWHAIFIILVNGMVLEHIYIQHGCKVILLVSFEVSYSLNKFVYLESPFCQLGLDVCFDFT